MGALLTPPPQIFIPLFCHLFVHWLEVMRNSDQNGSCCAVRA